MQISLQLENTDKQFSGHRTVNLDGQERGEMTPKKWATGKPLWQGEAMPMDTFIVLVMMISHLYCCVQQQILPLNLSSFDINFISKTEVRKNESSVFRVLPPLKMIQKLIISFVTIGLPRVA